jgi:hypothetical protein
MTVSFSKAKKITNNNVSSIVENTDPLAPPSSIKRAVNEGRAQKICVPYTTTVNSEVQYNTVWQPLGQEGWIEKLQCTLHGDDVISEWLGVNTGQILLVHSNSCDEYGADDTSRPPYERLPQGSTWYVDKITISGKKGYLGLADMELTLVRCWE